MAENNKIKIAGYAKRIFFNDNIEYRNFSPDLVGLQLTSEGGTTLFTNGNFSIDVNLDPKPNILFKQGTKSKLYCLDDIVTNSTEQTIQKNIKTKLNLDLTNPLSYIWYGSAEELVRSSLLQAQDKWPAAIYVDDKVGSVTGNNITNYVYDISRDESTFTVNSRFFVNPYGIKYTLDFQYTPSVDTSNKLRNFTVNYSSYVIEHNGISKNIKNITPASQTTNSDLVLVVDGNPFPELTGIYIPTLSFLFTNVDASIPYFIKPNETEIEGFFSSLNNFQTNILTRETNPPYKSIIISTNATDDGVMLTSSETLLFPILEDGYNLNFFDSFYLTYLDKINNIGINLDQTKTDIIIRKYTTEAINSFDTVPRGDGDDLTLNGEKATKLLRIYGVEFDEVKKYINGIKFAHVVTYNKKDNVPDSLVKDLSHMLGLDPITFVTSTTFNKLLLPSNGSGQFSGTSVNYTQEQIDIELYRRLILNIGWLWKSKGTRKAVEFLFRFIGAPEALVNFNEYLVMVDKPLDMDGIKKLLYIYTGEVNENVLSNIPYDENGYPLPPIDGQLVVTDFIDTETGELVEDGTTDMYFQKGGGWYRETYGSGSPTILYGNNPHVGEYDGGSEYLNYFSRCYIPNFNSEPTVKITANTITKNYFTNYNYGIFNGIPTGTTDFYTTQLTYNSITNGYQPIDDCVVVNYSIIESPLQNDGKTTFQQQYAVANQEYLDFLLKIEVDSYLQYSPEWQVIKNNYELAQNNCLLEVSTENCDSNNTLEICISELDIDIKPFNCDTLSAVTDCSPFLYYVDDTGTKVTFDEFGSCCTTLGYTHVPYINESGIKSEYCSKLAPCVGTPLSQLENGVVVFQMANNTIPTNIYTLFNQKCVQSINDVSQTESSYFSGIPNINSFQEYIDQINENQILTGLFYELFTFVDCPESDSLSTTIISSPECCAWYGYDYQVINSSDDKQYIVCVENGGQESPELVINSLNPLFPIVNISANTTYNEYQNPAGDIVSYFSTNMFKDCFDESVILLGPDTNSNSLFITPNALFSSTTLNIPSEWKVNTIDQYGRISFTPKDPFYDFILDWNSNGQLATLYKEVADFYNYTFGQFTFNCDGILIPYYNSGTFIITPPDVITAAVDSTRIGCDDINNVSVTFASEKWQGFRLPELDDCSCTIDFSFDYMLKYTAENLMECVKKDPCNPSIFSDVSLNNLNCRNFITFTSNEEDPTDPLSLINNFNSETSSSEEYVIWQNNNCIIEPSTDCCNAIGGNVVSLNEWASNNQTWVNFIYDQYQSIVDGEIIGGVPVQLIDYITNLNTTFNSLTTTLNGCYSIPTSLFGSCDINYSEYIQTQNICSLDVPLECGLWTNTLSNYRLLIGAIENIISEFNKNCGRPTITNLDGTISDGDKTLVNHKNEIATKELSIILKENTLKIELKNELSGLLVKRAGLDVKINERADKIKEKESDNQVISKSTTEINTNLDCTIYDVKIKELDNFNYNNFCTLQVYGTISSTKLNKNDEFNNCVSVQKLKNENEKIIYNDLLKNCQTSNGLQGKLVKAKFENDGNLITTLEKEVFITQTRINLLTQRGSEFIEPDSSLQKSVLQSNNIVNTINRTAELLNTTTENITNSEGNLSLSDSQKIQLNIIFVKNESKISSLTSEMGELESEKNENISKSAIIGTIGGTKRCPTPGNIGFGQSTNPIGQITFNGIPLGIDCCTKSVLGFNVEWVGNGCYPKGFISPNGDVPPNGDVDCCPTPGNIGFGQSANPIGQITFNGTPLGVECCTKSVLGFDVEWTDYGCYPKGFISPNGDVDCCTLEIFNELNNTLTQIESVLSDIETSTEKCYSVWLNTLNQNYENFLVIEQQNYLKYLDDLKINFKLFVNNTSIDTNTNIDTDLTYLPYTQSINPIWAWDPTQQYSGVILSGSEINIATIEDSIFDALASQNVDFSPDMFEPNWQTLNYTIPECVCDDLRRLYPNKEFFFSIEIENYECSVCLLVDNIRVNVTDCKTNRLITLNDCLVPQLSCIIDNKKSWVYTDKGVVTNTIYPDGECNVDSSNNTTITKLTTPEERLWTNLEYRYTNYDVHHSDLIINVKNTSFSIDPAKSIECDVYNFWKNIDCDECPTSCTSGETIVFSGQVYSSTTLDDYTLDVSASTVGISFSCDTYTTILTNQVLELKNDYYTLTADYNNSLNASYYDLLKKGGSLSKFYIQKNNCGSDTIVINNNSNLDNLFGLITENNDGTISFYESYLYSGTTPYSGGVLTEVLSGITAQTFNQTTGITLECCTTLNGLINDEGTLGLGIGKKYVWDTTTSSCNWKEINSCKGDCEYYGTKKVISREDCLSGITTGTTVGVCVNPISFLDSLPSEINIKDNFDTMVLSNLIDAKSRQTISDYPLLRLFYQLYLTANNCGEEFTGKLTYNNLFEFMDKIGDYWLDLLEQVVPATTIWEGCDNSGKIYRNTIFDQNKYEYKKYNLNVLCGGHCSVSGKTDFSIGSQEVYAVLEQIPLYPTNVEIKETKNNILTTKVLVSSTQKQLKQLNKQLCSLNLQDIDTDNLEINKDSLNIQISGTNVILISQQTNLSNLLILLEQQQNDYIVQQQDYYSKFSSCSGLTESLVNAQNTLSNFTPGTTNYERQRTFIANVRSNLSKCIRKSYMLKTKEESTAFITQIYDTNEFEGNVIILGDSDWYPDGPFYNTELIHNCI